MMRGAMQSHRRGTAKNDAEYTPPPVLVPILIRGEGVHVVVGYPRSIQS